MNNCLNHLGFGLWHFQKGWDDDPKKHALVDKYCFEKQLVNFICGGIPSPENEEYSAKINNLKKVIEQGMAIWLYTFPVESVTVDGKQQNVLKKDWKEQISRLVENAKKEGIWDSVAGFSYDEPMLTIDGDTFLELSREVAKYGKRQMCCFSVYEIVEGSHPRFDDPEFGKTAHVISPEYCQFLTDISYDSYGYTSYSYHKLMTEEMKRRAGREEIHVWLTPCTWSYFNRFDEDHSLEHLESCYRLLMEQENPGGLYCYNWYSFRKNRESLDWLFEDSNPERWVRLEKRMLEIAGEITKLPLKV